MNSAKKIADYLLNNDNYHIIVHKNPDGDCLGSSKALCLALQSIGKKAKIILPNPPSSRLRFFWDEELELGDFPCDNVISVDVASYGQMGDLYDVVFKNAPYSICIDHHGTNEGYAKLNYVDFTSSSTGELIFEIIELMDIDITEKIAKSLLISIADDTGCFQYSNTSARTHLTAAKLYEIIPDPEPTMRALYNTHSLGEIEALKHIMPSLEYHLGGKVCIMCADIDFLNSQGAESSNVDAWVGLGRSINGVEVSCLFKIHSDNEVKLSLRSNDYVDVSLLAAKFGGGGHKRASGVTFFENVNDAKQKILDELKKLV